MVTFGTYAKEYLIDHRRARNAMFNSPIFFIVRSKHKTFIAQFQFNPFDTRIAIQRSRNRSHFSIKNKTLTADLVSLFWTEYAQSIVKVVIKFEAWMAKIK